MNHALPVPKRTDSFNTMAVPEYLKFLEETMMEVMRVRGHDCKDFRLHLNEHGHPDAVYFTRPMDAMELLEIAAWRNRQDEERRRGKPLPTPAPPQGRERYRAPSLLPPLPLPKQREDGRG